MNTYKTVTAFLDDLDADMQLQVMTVRDIILETEPALVENIKWNAPNYVFNGQDRLTFNVQNKEGKLKLVLHMGASKKENKHAAPVINEKAGTISWNSNIRGVITFENLEDIITKQAAIAAAVTKWLAVK